MEIVHLKNDTYQVINLSDNTALYQGDYDDCLLYMINIEQQYYKSYYEGQ